MQPASFISLSLSLSARLNKSLRMITDLASRSDEQRSAKASRKHQTNTIKTYFVGHKLATGSIVLQQLMPCTRPAAHGSFSLSALCIAGTIAKANFPQDILNQNNKPFTRGAALA